MARQNNRYLINPPSQFPPVAEWRAFLESLKSADQDNPAVQHAMEEARRTIAFKHGGCLCRPA